ncbi:hypothetical protein NFHSH190041_08850 [Shewanella sp. NFH-SH190041]|uniref:DUF1266 domain-containing protein n=1 Tax=Shewanella sp. NFH-SH190041 TaxID=2950245 RepID=UPI0021C3596D|nr:DUF1266 domain-containing protein [Shewanella sp. NFH-SH190041]BDM63433.1 hypothetical protein NFHSH190041_08850 [Shewanella sp. NFH-SH190041]
MQKYNQFDTSLPHCQWWMALTTSQSIVDDDVYDFMALGLRKDHPDKADWLNDLNNGWGISSREEFLHTIMRLIHAEVHGDSLLSELDFIHFAGSDQWQEYIDDQQDDKIRTTAQFADLLYHHCGLGGIRAWDYSRAGYLIRACYFCEQLTHDETCFLLNLTAQRAQYFYHSWEQYLAASILGRNYWLFGNKTRQGPLENWGDKLLNQGLGYEYDEFYQDLLPYQPLFNQLDWHTPLPELAVPISLSELFNQEDAA